MRSLIFISMLFLSVVATTSTGQAPADLTPRKGGIEQVNYDGLRWGNLLPRTGLAGWTIVGGSAKFEREGDELHGFRAGSRNTFLISDRKYGNFILEGEIKIEPGGNSGWQVRSHQKNPNDRRSGVQGYQIEVDSAKRKWSGGLYDEDRRGWIHSLENDEHARSAFKVGEWNHFRIEADAGHIRSWVNRIPCADVLDFADLNGSIAFQVHSGQCDVRWRNLKIAELGLSVFEVPYQAWFARPPAFAQQPDRSIKGQSGSAPVSAHMSVRGDSAGGGHPGVTIRFGYKLQGKAIIRIQSNGQAFGDLGTGLAIHLDSENPENDGEITGFETVETEFPVVVPGAGLDSDSAMNDLVIDVERDRVTVLRDGKVLNRVYAKGPIQTQVIQIELPPTAKPGANQIHFTKPSLLIHKLPDFLNGNPH